MIKMYCAQSILGLAIAVAMTLTPAHGAVMNGNTADAGVDDGATNTPEVTANTVSSTTFRVGFSGTAGRAGVYPFQLPNLGAVVNPFATATATLTATSNPTSALPSAIDLTGLAPRATATVLASDYQATATAIQPGFLPVTGAAVAYNTSTSGSAALLAYLNTAYAGGANIGKYVFLRLEPTTEGVTSSFTGYNIGTADNGNSVQRPLITYTVPEPAALAIVGSAAVLALRRRRDAR